MLVTDFATAGIKNGKQYYRYYCKTCYWESKKPRIEKNKLWFKEYKKTLSCARCGNDDHRVLQFHHLKDKRFLISNSKSRSIKTIKKEMAKCEILCANCHAKEHHIESVL